MQVVSQRVSAVIFRIEADVGRDARQDVIGGDKDAIALAKEAYMPIGVPRCPDHPVLLTYQVEVLSILDQGDGFMGRYANDVAQLLRVGLREPRLSRRHRV